LAAELDGPQTPDGSGTGRNRDRPSQPAFYSRNLVASLIVPDQSTHVFGGMINPNGDGLTYVLLTATQIDSLGRPLADYAGEAVEHAPHYMRVPVTNTGAELDE